MTPKIAGERSKAFAEDLERASQIRAPGGAAEADARRLGRRSRDGEGVADDDADARVAQMLHQHDAAPRLGEAEPEMERLALRQHPGGIEELGRQSLARHGLAPDRRERSVGRAIGDPARRQRRHQRRRHHRRGMERRGEARGMARIGRDEISDAEPRGYAFREAGDVIGELRRQHGKGRRRLLGQTAIGVVLDDRHAVAPRDGDDGMSSFRRDRRRCRILQRRIAVERFRCARAARRRESVGVDALLVEGKSFQRTPQYVACAMKPGYVSASVQTTSPVRARLASAARMALCAPGQTKSRSGVTSPTCGASQRMPASRSLGEPPNSW